MGTRSACLSSSSIRAPDNPYLPRIRSPRCSSQRLLVLSERQALSVPTFLCCSALPPPRENRHTTCSGRASSVGAARAGSVGTGAKSRFEPTGLKALPSDRTTYESLLRPSSSKLSNSSRVNRSLCHRAAASALSLHSTRPSLGSDHPISTQRSPRCGSSALTSAQL
jgi:hypothetical protein